MITITSKRHNFRRCGMPHPKGTIEYPEDRFAEAELAILEAEPMLMVEYRKDKPEISPDDLVDAAKAAVDAGDVTRDGKPEVKAIEDILGRNITAAERDETWTRIKGEE